MEHKIDAKDKIVGRIASELAVLLMGKNLPTYRDNKTPDVSIKVFNTDFVKVTGRKEIQKIYRRHSGVIGNLKEETLKHLRARDSRQIIKNALIGMLPKNKLRKVHLRKIQFYKKEIEEK